MDTIFALATAKGKAGVAVVRISGPEATAAGLALAGNLPAPRQAGLRKLRWRGEQLDEGLVLRFEAGNSFTGEEIVELHLHGAHAVILSVLKALGEMPRLRIAAPGEFTRRALENGRLDLTQVEGLADLIDAETEAQRQQALMVLSGAVGNLVDGWRAKLLRAAALLAAVIDFSDEDVPSDVTSDVLALIIPVSEDITAELRGLSAAERVREGFEVAIVGRPNAGKSTLLNALAKREAAITSDYAGTTRDVIEVRMDLGGLPVTLLDTAGLRDSVDPLERMGIEKALKRAEAADLRVFLLDEEEIPLMRPKGGDLLFQGKADLRGPAERKAVSGKTGEGIDQLVEAIVAELGPRAVGAGLMTRERHRDTLENAIGALELSTAALEEDRTDIAAEELRRAILALEVLMGRVDTEQMLDEIFASFCIGK